MLLAPLAVLPVALLAGAAGWLAGLTLWPALLSGIVVVGALALGTRSYSSVAAILKNAQDRKPREPDHPSLFHENIRGPGYYH